MEKFVDYIKPELLIVTIVLYFIGMVLKKMNRIKDKYIPVILGILGIVICSFYVFGICVDHSQSNYLKAIFTSVTQGILVAGLSTYVNQIFKQISKKE